MPSASLVSSTSGQSSADGFVSGNVAATSLVHRVRCPYSIFKGDEFEETSKSDEIHCMRDNNNGCS